MMYSRIWSLALAATLLGASCSSAGSVEDSSETAVAPTPVVEDLQAIAEGSLPDGLAAVIIGVFEPELADFAAVGVDGDGRPASPEDPWFTASLGKVVTATAVMQLVDAGFVELDTAVAEYVSFPISEDVTVRHLLGHTSGIPNMFSHVGACGDERTLDAARGLAAQETATEPGTVGSYSNTNYLLLGLLIEAVTGQDPGAYMRQEIFEPLGMESSYWYESQEGPRPYMKSPSNGTSEVPVGCSRIATTIGTDGAMVSSLADFDAFYRALFAGELVTDDSLAEMLDMDTEQFGYRYGLGILEMVDESRPGETLYGFGGSGYYQTAAFHDPAKQRTVAVVTTGSNQVSLLWKAIDWANAQAG